MRRGPTSRRPVRPPARPDLAPGGSLVVSSGIVLHDAPADPPGRPGRRSFRINPGWSRRLVALQCVTMVDEVFSLASRPADRVPLPGARPMLRINDRIAIPL